MLEGESAILMVAKDLTLRSALSEYFSAEPFAVQEGYFQDSILSKCSRILSVGIPTATVTLSPSTRQLIN